MNRRLSVVLMAGLAAGTTSNALAATQTKTHGAKPTAKAHKYKGPFVDMRWGPVRAIITIKGKKLTAVKIVTSPENFRSSSIDEQAVPMLVQETLQAQSATINEVSGATMTSDAYMQSLQEVIKKAHFKAKGS